MVIVLLDLPRLFSTVQLYAPSPGVGVGSVSVEVYAPATPSVIFCEAVPIVRGEQFLRHTTLVTGPPLDSQVKVGALYARVVTEGSPVCVCVGCVVCVGGWVCVGCVVCVCVCVGVGCVCVCEVCDGCACGM